MNQITLGKKKYPIRFTMFVLSQVEQETDHKNILAEITDWGLHDALTMAYYGCRKANPDFNMSLEEIGDLFEPETLTEVFNAFTKDMVRESAEPEKKT